MKTIRSGGSWLNASTAAIILDLLENLLNLLRLKSYICDAGDVQCLPSLLLTAAISVESCLHVANLHLQHHRETLKK